MPSHDSDIVPLIGPRSLTDADAEAIAMALERRVRRRFYEDLGKGLWSWVWKVLLGSLIAIAAYGGLKGLK